MSEEGSTTASNEDGMKCQVNGEDFKQDCKTAGDNGEDDFVFTEYEDLEDLDKIDFSAYYEEDLINKGDDNKAN